MTTPAPSPSPACAAADIFPIIYENTKIPCAWQQWAALIGVFCCFICCVVIIVSLSSSENNNSSGLKLSNIVKQRMVELLT